MDMISCMLQAMLRSSSAHGQALFFNCNLALLKNNHPPLQTHQLVNCVQVIISNRNKILVSFSPKVLEHVLSNSRMGVASNCRNPTIPCSMPHFPREKIQMTWISQYKNPRNAARKTGVGKCPMTWEYWTSPYSSHYRPLIPNGWVMFNGDI